MTASEKNHDGFDVALNNGLTARFRPRAGMVWIDVAGIGRRWDGVLPDSADGWVKTHVPIDPEIALRDWPPPTLSVRSGTRLPHFEVAIGLDERRRGRIDIWLLTTATIAEDALAATPVADPARTAPPSMVVTPMEPGVGCIHLGTGTFDANRYYALLASLALETTRAGTDPGNEVNP